MPDLDLTDRKLLNLLQSSFPLIREPFAELARQLDIPHEETLARLRRLRELGVLRHLSAIFDVFRIGYKSALIACAVPPERLDEAADHISAHPGVSHNYARDHWFNLWFVLAIPRAHDFEETVAQLAQGAGATRYLLLPATKLFKIGVQFDMVEGVTDSEGGNPDGPSGGVQQNVPRRPLAEEEKALVRVLQRDIPIEERPLAAMAAPLGMDEDELLAQARAFLDAGIMRRFAGVLRHQEAGFTANGMACWRVPEERIEEVGRKLASHRRVSHCYRRPTYPDWPYALYSMVHAQTRDQCETVVAELARLTGIADYVILYSTREYKKERVQYFVEEPAPAPLQTR